MKNCPYFECLAHSSEKCSKYEACEGCPTNSSCDACSRQETLIDGIRVPCEHMAPFSSSATPSRTQTATR